MIFLCTFLDTFEDFGDVFVVLVLLPLVSLLFSFFIFPFTPLHPFLPSLFDFPSSFLVSLILLLSPPLCLLSLYSSSMKKSPPSLILFLSHLLSFHLATPFTSPCSSQNPLLFILTHSDLLSSSVLPSLSLYFCFSSCLFISLPYMPFNPSPKVPHFTPLSVDVFPQLIERFSFQSSSVLIFFPPHTACLPSLPPVPSPSLWFPRV